MSRVIRIICTIVFYVLFAAEATIAGLSFAATVALHLWRFTLVLGVLALVFLAASLLFALFRRWAAAAACAAVFGALNVALGLNLMALDKATGKTVFWNHYAGSALLFLPALVNAVLALVQRKKKDYAEYLEAKKTKTFR